MADVGVARVGCGQIAEANLKAIEACVGARLVYFVEFYAKLSRPAAERYRGAEHAIDLDSAINNPNVDAVVICLPHDLHVAFTCEGLSAGKHILVEKPLAVN